jgi:hypothetical protein
MIPVFNNNNAQSLAANANFCAITAPMPAAAQQGGAQSSAQMLEVVSYYIAGGSTGVGTIITFQELGGDGTWRAMVGTAGTGPGVITLANSTNYNGSFNGPFHGIRLAMSGLVGNGASYAELKGTVRTL